MMLGPMKKRLITTGIVSCVIPTVIFLGIFIAYSKNKNEEIANLEIQVETVPRWIAKADMPIGHVVTMTDIEQAEVKEISAPVNSFENFSGLVGGKLKVPVYSGTIMTSAMFYEFEDGYNIDVRNKEFNMITLPSDLVEGDYVDIRILFPTGEDYVVISGKEIKKVGSTHDSNAIFMDLTEEEMNRMSSAVIESYISSSIKLYAVKYSDWYEQLYDEVSVDYVKFAQAAIEGLIEESKVIEYIPIEQKPIPMVDESGEVIRDESGEIMYMPQEEKTEPKETKKEEIEFTDQEVFDRMILLMGIENADWAKYTKLTLEDVKAIRRALRNPENEAEILSLYAQKSILVETKIKENYPVKLEVASLIEKNPNIIEKIDEKYNIAQLQLERELIESGYIGESLKEQDTQLGNIASELDAEITTQKTERSEYLQSLVRQEMLTTTVQ